MASEFITLARVLKTQGRRGEVAVELHTSDPERFLPGLKLLALGEDGARRELLVEELWPHKGLLVLKFRDIDSISDAESVVRCELQVPLSERAPLESGWTYVSDLTGCTVFDGEHEIGTISRVEFGAGEAPLLVVKALPGAGAGSNVKEYEIPFAEAYLNSVDLAKKQVRMSLPEGMLEVNAPLTAEEKQEQQREKREK